MSNVDPNLPLPRRPRIPPDIRFVTTAVGHRVYFGGEEPITIDGQPLAYRLLDMLDGTRTLDDLVAEFVATWRASEAAVSADANEGAGEVGSALREKIDRLLTGFYLSGLLEEGDSTGARPHSARTGESARREAFFSRTVDVTRAAPSGRQLLQRLHESRVVVEGDGEIAQRCASRLHELGVAGAHDEIQADAPDGAHTVRPNPTGVKRGETVAAPADLVVVAMDAPTRGALLQFNRTAVSSQIPTLFAWLEPNIFRLGPLVESPDTPCLECYLHRRRAAAPIPQDELAFWDLSDTEAGAAFAHLPETVDTATSMLTLEIQRVITYFAIPATVSGHVVGFDVLRGTTSRTRVLRLPFCSACSSSRPIRRYFT